MHHSFTPYQFTFSTVRKLTAAEAEKIAAAFIAAVRDGVTDAIINEHDEDLLELDTIHN